MELINLEKNLPQKSLFSVILILSIPFLIGYFIFFALHDQITYFQRPSNELIRRVIDPHTTALTEHDGIEPKVLFLLMLFIGPAGYLLFQSSLSKRLLSGIALVLWIIFIIKVEFFQTFFSQIIADGVILRWVEILFIFGILVFILNRLYQKIPLLAQFLIVSITLLVCFFPYSDVSYYDYAFVLAPALRILQGAKISETYFQYDFLPTLPALAVLKYDWSVYAYRYFVQGGMFLFVIVSFITARKFFMHKGLAIYLFAMIMVIRFFMGMSEVTFIPQITAIRLDWWLLLFACACFGGGIKNIKLGICFLLLIVLSNGLGVIYFVCYLLLLLLLLALELYNRFVTGQPFQLITAAQNSLKKYGVNISLGFAGVLLHYIITGHLVNEGISIYGGFQLGMLPVNQDSSYWHFATIFAISFGLLLTFRKAFTDLYFNNSLFLLALCTGCSLYFFGRSHENNVINISGILLFVVLLCCDVLLKLTKASERGSVIPKALSLTPVWLILTIMIVNYSGLFATNFRDYISAFKNGTWTYSESQPEAGALETFSSLTKGSRNIYFMTFDATDFYFYYRGKYNMPSKFNPVDSWVVLSDKITFANQKLEEGYYIAGVETDHLIKRDYLPKLNYNEYFTNGQYFVIHK